MNDPQSLHVITSWLNALSRLGGYERTPTADEIKSRKEKIALYATMLAGDLPSAAFTEASMRYAYRGKRGFPDCAVILSELTEWWNANRPAIAPRISGPKGPELSPEDQRALDSFERRHNGEKAHEQAPRGQALSFLEAHFPGAFNAAMRDTQNRGAYEDWINQGSPAKRLSWNHRQIMAASMAEKERLRDLARMEEMDRHAAD